MVNLSKYRKAFVGASGVLVVLGEALSDGAVSGQEALSLVVALSVAFGVYGVPNKTNG
jgi:hypothetical protein